jgi:hypothetical protein
MAKDKSFTYEMMGYLSSLVKHLGEANYLCAVDKDTIISFMNSVALMDLIPDQLLKVAVKFDKREEGNTETKTMDCNVSAFYFLDNFHIGPSAQGSFAFLLQDIIRKEKYEKEIASLFAPADKKLIATEPGWKDEKKGDQGEKGCRKVLPLILLAAEKSCQTKFSYDTSIWLEGDVLKVYAGDKQKIKADAFLEKYFEWFTTSKDFIKAVNCVASHIQDVMMEGKYLRWATGANNRPSLYTNVTNCLGQNLDADKLAECGFVSATLRRDTFFFSANVTFESSGRRPIDNLSEDCAIGAKNQFRIFHGSPGTGKTRKAKDEARILLQSENAPGFNNPIILQVHPSYTYEDLIEGLKPITFEDGAVRYDVVEGPLRIAAHTVSGPDKLNGFARILTRFCRNQDGDIAISFPAGTKSRYGLERVNLRLIRKLVSTENTAKKKGTTTESGELEFGCDVYLFKKDSSEFFQELEKLCSKDPQFVHVHMRDSRWGKEVKNRVLILDEINRGNIAQLMGELLYVISEKDSDEKQPVVLQYSNDKFEWPEGLHLFGTMNSADTSTDRLDQAIKRRFSLCECAPDPELFKSRKTDIGPAIFRAFGDLNQKLSPPQRFKGLDHLFESGCKASPLSLLLETINSKLKNPKNSLGIIHVNDKLLGHSYFLRMARLTCEQALKQFEDKATEETVLKSLKENGFDHAVACFYEEVLPAMLSIFNNEEDNIRKFFSENLNVTFDSERAKCSVSSKSFSWFLVHRLLFNADKELDERKDPDRERKSLEDRKDRAA